MVIVYLLTILDAVTAFVLATHVALGWFSAEVVAYHAAYIILKGLIFFLTDWSSRIDVVIGAYMALVAFDILSFNMATVTSVVWLLQKGIFLFITPILKIFF